MKKTIFTEDEFCREVDKLCLPTLELMLEKLSEDKEANHEKIDIALSRRKQLLTDMFECTPNDVDVLCYVNRLIKERADILREKGNQLYVQTVQIWQEDKNEPFNDFNIELSLRVCYNDEDSIRNFYDNYGSNYAKMAALINDYTPETRGNLMCCAHLNYDPKENNSTFEVEELVGEWYSHSHQFPALQKIPACWEFHQLVDHTYYSLQDIMRIKDIWGEAKVVWQHTTKPAW